MFDVVFSISMAKNRFKISKVPLDRKCAEKFIRKTVCLFNLRPHGVK